MKDLKLKISKARTSLILGHPFIGTIALNMPMEIMTPEFEGNMIANGITPTAATNGKRVLFSADFIRDLTDEQMVFLVAHECLHPMLDHNFRRNSRDPKKWNMAGDYVINQLLTEDKIGRFIEGGCLDKNIYDAGGGTTDGIYNILPAAADDGIGGTGMDLEDGEGSPADQEQAAAEWKVKVAQAAQAAKMMGKMSANMQRLVDEVLTPKVNWRDVLHRFLVRCNNDSRSFARFNRRFVSQNLYLPSVSACVRTHELVFAVDCSGSIDQHTINQFAAEVACVKDDLSPAAIHVIYFDSEVSHYETYGPDDALNIKPHGGGGTDFAPVFEKIVELGIEPVAVVFLTDLYCDSFGNEPACPVLWVTTDETEAPFGEIVEMN